MATMYQKVVNDLVERLEAKAVEIARLKQEKLLLIKQLEEASAKRDELLYHHQRVNTTLASVAS